MTNTHGSEESFMVFIYDPHVQGQRLVKIEENDVNSLMKALKHKISPDSCSFF